MGDSTYGYYPKVYICVYICINTLKEYKTYYK